MMNMADGRTKHIPHTHYQDDIIQRAGLETVEDEGKETEDDDNAWISSCYERGRGRDNAGGCGDDVSEELCVRQVVFLVGSVYVSDVSCWDREVDFWGYWV